MSDKSEIVIVNKKKKNIFSNDTFLNLLNPTIVLKAFRSIYIYILYIIATEIQ